MKLFIELFLLSITFSCANNTNNKVAENTIKVIPQYAYIEGNTQGSTFHIKYKTNGDTIESAEFYKIFSSIDHSLSIYTDSSIISKINNNIPNVITDKYFEDVFKMSDSVYKLSNGLFDITVGPLVKEWGFTPGGHKNLSQNRISELKKLIGFNKIKLENHQLIKSNPEILIDPNAIAQGYTCEVVADFLNSEKITDYMIEIGGEVKTKGLNDKGEPWKIGVDKPISEDQNVEHELQTILSVTNLSVCTSGSYRKFIEENGIKYSHTINPLTGYPTHHNLLSVTVVTENCTYADAIATSLMVMGLDDAKKFINSHKNIEAYLIFSNKNGDFETWSSEGLKKMIKNIE